MDINLIERVYDKEKITNIVMSMIDDVVEGSFAAKVTNGCGMT